MPRRKKSSLTPKIQYHYMQEVNLSSHNNEEHPYDKPTQNNTEFIERWTEAMKGFCSTFDVETELSGMELVQIHSMSS
ncbi:hypothetical protein SNE40_018236 [Patella caerulea]|uniref:Uncharacterized protein n=1 Tax=Patella caerulea TaxID=87958 RepID=A0AAN8PAJ1_PATCE